MERNNGLTTIKNFKHQSHFQKHLHKLLTNLYPNASFNENTIVFKEAPYMGISIDINSDSLHPELTEYFRDLYPKFKNNGEFFFDLVNTPFKWTGSTGHGYMYPFDRNMFKDSKLGMEQKAAFFIVVMEVTLKFLIKK